MAKQHIQMLQRPGVATTSPARRGGEVLAIVLSGEAHGVSRATVRAGFSRGRCRQTPLCGPFHHHAQAAAAVGLPSSLPQLRNSGSRELEAWRSQGRVWQRCSRPRYAWAAERALLCRCCRIASRSLSARASPCARAADVHRWEQSKGPTVICESLEVMSLPAEPSPKLSVGWRRREVDR